MIINMADLIPLKAGRKIYSHFDLNDIFQFIFVENMFKS